MDSQPPRAMDNATQRPHLSSSDVKPSRSRRIFWLCIVGGLLVVLFGGLYGWQILREGMIKKFLSAPQPPAVVSSTIATEQTVPKYLAGIGTLQAVHQVTVSPEVAGRVTQIMFEPGASVQAGDPLVQLFDKPERGDLATYEAQAKLAELNLGRARALIRREFETQVNVDLQQSNLDIANANIGKSQALITQKLVRAPFSGQLGVRQIDLGQYLTAGAAVVTLTDLGMLYVNFTLPEQTRSQLVIGQEVDIQVDAYPSRPFKAKLTTIEPQINADTRNIKVQATLENPEHLLLPGMFANARIVLPPQANVLTLPETAVDYSLYGDSVFLITDDGKDADGKPKLKVVRTFVKTGDRQNSTVSIVSGLKAGDKVVASGQVKLNSGAAVTIKEDNALVPPAVPPRN